MSRDRCKGSLTRLRQEESGRLLMVLQTFEKIPYPSLLLVRTLAIAAILPYVRVSVPCNLQVLSPAPVVEPKVHKTKAFQQPLIVPSTCPASFIDLLKTPKVMSRFTQHFQAGDRIRLNRDSGSSLSQVLLQLQSILLLNM